MSLARTDARGTHHLACYPKQHLSVPPKLIANYILKQQNSYILGLYPRGVRWEVVCSLLSVTSFGGCLAVKKKSAVSAVVSRVCLTYACGRRSRRSQSKRAGQGCY
jgi:hypothetical protein